MGILEDGERIRANLLTGGVSENVYDALVKRLIDAELQMQNMVPRSRIAAIEEEKAQVEQVLKDVQKYGHAEITRLETENKRFREALAWIANYHDVEYVSKAKEHARNALVKQPTETPWAELTMRVPDENGEFKG